jgi:hypothetical protein
MLKGQAKADYMRAYMRRKRAGLPTTTAKPWQPSQGMIDQVAYWARVRASGRISSVGARILGDLPLDTDASFAEALRRLRAHQAALRAGRKAQPQEAGQPRRCWFCDKPRRPLYGDAVRSICARCARKAVKAFSAARAKTRRRKR